MGTGRPQAPSRRPRSAALAGLALLISLLAAGCDPAPVAPPPPRLDPEPLPAPAVLEPATGPASAVLPVARLERLLDSGPLGPRPGAVVVDLATGAVLLDREAAAPRTPASVLKLATGAAALITMHPDSRLKTRVVRGSAGELILVGAGDTTLTARPDPNTYPARAGLVALADATAAALRAEGDTAGDAGGDTGFAVRVDDSAFSGPAVSPDWPASYVGSGVVAPVSALTLDGGRVNPRADARSPDPAITTGAVFARLLSRRGVTVTGDVTRAPAPEGAVEVAAVESPTVAELVELMLASSDNDLAESLLRLVALARDRPGTFADGTAVVAQVLAGLGVPTDGMVLLDGSGLARGSAIAPMTLARLLALAAGDSDPALDHLLGGLPVAGFSGTLSVRFLTGPGRAGAGLVRAKTGTLTGVSTLAGVTGSGDGAVVLVVMADEVPGDTLAARATLDRIAALVARSGDPREPVGR